jgi:hypothetical protein
MSESHFYTLCAEYYIEPSIALENDDVILALKNQDDVEVERILTHEF